MRFLFAVFLSFSGNRHRHVRISFEKQLTKMTYYWYYFSFSYYFFAWVQRSVCQPKESKQIHSQMLNNYIHLIIQKVHIREYILATTSQRWEMMMAELLISDEKTNDSWSHSNSYMSNGRSFGVFSRCGMKDDWFSHFKNELFVSSRYLKLSFIPKYINH